MAEPRVRFKQDDGSSYPDIQQIPFGDVVKPFVEKTKIENEDVLLSCAINGVFLNTELFGHQRGASNKGYKKIRRNTLILSAQNLHLGNANVNQRFDHGIISPAYNTYDIVGCDPDYMAQWVKREATKKFFYDATTTGASQCRRNVDWNALYEQIFYVPCEEEQQKIADFLSSVDEVIAASEQEVANLETQKKAVMKKIFSQEVRFKKADETDFPEWEEKLLGDIAEIVGGGTPDTSIEEYWKDGSIEWFTPTEVGHNKYVNCSKRKISQLGFAKSSARLLPARTILLTSRATIGEMSIAEKECCTNQGFQSLVVHSDVDNEFVYYCQPVIKQYGLKHAAGSTFLEISGSNVAKCPIRVPCLEEQHLIADFLSDFDETIAAAKKELELWKELKKGLLQQMFV